MRSNLTRLATCVAIVMLTATTALTQSFDLSWNTIDGGGATSVAGGAYTLGGTIGQPDAQTAPVMSAGTFTLTGGFWSAAGQACTLPGDMNLDGGVDGQDVQLFVNCVLSINGANCGCADFDGSGSATAADVPLFVAAVLAP